VAGTGNYNFAPLTRRIPWSEVAAEQPGMLRDTAVGITAILASVGYWLWWFVGPKLSLPPEWWFVEDGASILAGILAAACIAVVIVGAIMATMPITLRRKLRVRQFAAANGFHYRAYGVEPPRVGMLFGRIRAVIVDQLTSATGRSVRSRTGTMAVGVTIANAELYEETTENAPARNGKAVGTRGFVHVALTANSPHYLLDGSANNRPWKASIAASVRGHQKLSLEGDFDRHFTLYCPRGYERDALQLFTPDLMALLIDRGSAWDVEIIDDNLFVYSTRGFRLDRTRDLTRILAFVDLVVPKLGGRIERMGRPDPVNSGGPAAGGQRLAQRGSWVLLPVIGLLIVVVASNGLSWLAAR
jgi:hypothetical protein